MLATLFTIYLILNGDFATNLDGWLGRSGHLGRAVGRDHAGQLLLGPPAGDRRRRAVRAAGIDRRCPTSSGRRSSRSSSASSPPGRSSTACRPNCRARSPSTWAASTCPGWPGPSWPASWPTSRCRGAAPSRRRRAKAPDGDDGLPGDTHDVTPPAGPSTWPEGYRAAATLGFDMDAEDVALTVDPESRHRLSAMSHQAYGPLTGVPRVLDLLKRHDVRATFFCPGLHRRALPGRAAPGARRGPRDRPPRLSARGDGRDVPRPGGGGARPRARGARPGRRRAAGRLPRADVGDDVRHRRAAARPRLPLRLQPDGLRRALRAGRAARRRRPQHRRDPGRLGARRLGAVRVRPRAVRARRHRGPRQGAGDVDRRAHRGPPARLVLHADRAPVPERPARSAAGARDPDRDHAGAARTVARARPARSPSTYARST